MAVTEVKYSRTFLSKTGQTDTSYHGSPTYVDCQEISEEDGNIRKQMEHDFGFEVRHKGSGNYDREIFGFDGRMQYSFRISGHPKQEKDSSKNIPYQTAVNIKKAGSISDIIDDELSDLERFLKNKGFLQSE
jgi:hypothetical protein